MEFSVTIDKRSCSLPCHKCTVVMLIFKINCWHPIAEYLENIDLYLLMCTSSSFCFVFFQVLTIDLPFLVCFLLQMYIGFSFGRLKDGWITFYLSA